LVKLLSGIESYCFFVSRRRRVEKCADERIYTWEVEGRSLEEKGGRETMTSFVP
jgi:hypothetical protein